MVSFTSESWLGSQYLKVQKPLGYKRKPSRRNLTYPLPTHSSHQVVEWRARAGFVWTPTHTGRARPLPVHRGMPPERKGHSSPPSAPPLPCWGHGGHPLAPQRGPAGLLTMASPNTHRQTSSTSTHSAPRTPKFPEHQGLSITTGAGVRRDELWARRKGSPRPQTLWSSASFRPAHTCW